MSANYSVAKTISVKTKSDYLEKIQKVNPRQALEELIWNGLDADADEIHITFELDELGGVRGLRVRDNGSGIVYDDLDTAFGNLGGSWKRDSKTSGKKGRLLHGAAGRGRFRAFRLGQTIEWRSRYLGELFVEEFTVWGDGPSLENMYATLTEPCADSTGVEVFVSDITTNLSSLIGDRARDLLAQQFSPYLVNYPEVSIWYDGVLLDPASAIKDKIELKVEEIPLSSGDIVDVQITVFVILFYAMSTVFQGMN